MELVENVLRSDQVRVAVGMHSNATTSFVLTSARAELVTTLHQAETDDRCEAPGAGLICDGQPSHFRC